jgi:hypothetical protein
MDGLIRNLHLLVTTKKRTLGYFHWENMGDRRERILSHFQSIQELQLDQVFRFKTLLTVFEVICSFSLLEKLRLDIAWDDSTQEVPVERLPARLRSLQLSCDAMDHLLDAMLSFQKLPAITTVHLAHLTVHQIPSAASFLRELGSDLQHFKTMFPDSESAGTYFTSPRFTFLK